MNATRSRLVRTPWRGNCYSDCGIRMVMEDDQTPPPGYGKSNRGGERNHFGFKRKIRALRFTMAYGRRRIQCSEDKLSQLNNILNAWQSMAIGLKEKVTSHDLWLSDQEQGKILGRIVGRSTADRSARWRPKMQPYEVKAPKVIPVATSARGTDRPVNN